IALLMDGSEPRFFNGTVEGEITTEPYGEGGFGYDPLFRPEGWSKTFAQATPDEKNAVSHRGRAVRQLVAYLATLSQQL
ncbi:MAG: non-canonical purine NTP pyrophosphatase, partial [Muribaculaceae bacterium]|nr:non-canonical purine NTP pyrophosphatase [Muribaculaceae bacterium]